MRSGRRKIETIAPKRVLGASWGRLGQFLIDFRSQHGPKLAFKIDSKSIKNPSPNRSQNWSILGSIFGWISIDFGSENGAKLAPKSHPICGFLKILKKLFGASPLAPNEVRRIQVGSKNRLKNRSKKEINMGSHLGIDFWSILLDFGLQVGKENGTKIDPKRHPKNDENLKASWRRLGSVLEASWASQIHGNRWIRLNPRRGGGFAARSC